MGEVSPNVANRFRVLFDIWFPGKDVVDFEIVVCQKCGFVFYAPRPEASDIDQKYYFLNDCADESEGKLKTATSNTELRRADLLVKYLSKHIDIQSVGDILDFGGHDGRLMKPFIDKGHRTYLVDYTRNSIPGVIRLGDTLADLSADSRFDLIICSHVLEHVATPLEVIKQLRDHLTLNGTIFIEVPMDMLWQLPLQKEPVTHINFFTPHCLFNLLTLAGLKVKDCRLDSCFHPSGKKNYGIRAVAHKVKHLDGNVMKSLKDVDVNGYLQPNLLNRIRHICINPSSIQRISLRNIRRFFRLQ